MKSSANFFTSVAVAILWLALVLYPAQAEQIMLTERFGRLHLYSNTKNPEDIIILFSDNNGWDDIAGALAQSLVNLNYLVIGIDSSEYQKQIETETGDCAYLAGEIERLSQSVQSSLKISYYHSPLLLGVGYGASLAYAINVQFPSSFLGVISLNFCPTFLIKVPPCAASALKLVYNQEKHLLLSLPLKQSQNNFIIINNQTVTSCKKEEIQGYSSTPITVLEQPLSVENIFSFWLKPIELAIKQLKESEVEFLSQEQQKLSKLPLIIIPTEKDNTDYFVVFLSGDGGWATIDKAVGEHLSEHGINVVGFDSLKYFWKKKSPQSTAMDLQEIIDDYSRQWKKEKIILAGFSFGADVLPAIYNNLSERFKEKISKIILLSPTLSTDFEVHIGDWVGFMSNEKENYTLPEIKKISGNKIICLYGKDDQDGVCRYLEKENNRIIEFDGDHHFGGNYQLVTDLILSNLAK